MLIQLAFKDLVNEPKHLLSYILTIGSLIAVIVIPISIGNAYTEQLVGIIPRQDPHHYIIINSTASSLMDSILDYDLLKDALERQDVKILPQLIAYCRVTKGYESATTIMRGADLEQLYKFRNIGLRGSIPKNVSEVNVGILLAERLNASINQYIEVELYGEKYVFKVAGVVRCNCPYDEELLMSIREAWRLMPSLTRKAALVELSGRLDIEELKYLNVKVLPIQPASEALMNIVESTFNTIRNWAFAISVIVFFSSYFASLKICSDSLDRVKLLKAIGVSKRKIILFMFYKTMIASLISIIVGISSGIVLSQVIFRVASIILYAEAYKPPMLTLNDISLVTATVTLLSIAGSIPPIVRAGRMRF